MDITDSQAKPQGADMNSLDYVTLEVPDEKAAGAFYAAAFGLDDTVVRVRSSDEPTTGFRGYTLSLVVAQPSAVDSLVGTALEAGATSLKPVAKSFWGYGGSLQAPDGAIWSVATSSKKETGAPARQVDDIVLLLGAADVKASKRFYVERGLTVGKSFGSKYVEFDLPGSAVKLSLYSRRAAAKNAGVPAEGAGSHRIVIGGDAEPCTDPDGFMWETTSTRARSV